MSKPEIPAVGVVLHGFRIEAVTPLPAVRGAAVQAVHEATGARVFHLAADDAENLFSISFPTPPPDDTGLPHIMEHAALAGSRRFPVREPFFEMLKMSMSTFLNAMTGSDLTYYPVASNVRRDLFNLAEVYVDAVFHPLLTEAVFKREGHHLAPANPEDPLGALEVSGIVFNEMKGAYSSPDTRLYFTWLRGLMPGTIYARHSAGDPEAIPGLTYAEFAAFHRRHYHPSNAWFFLYGDIPTVDYLAFLEPKLAGFGRGEAISLQQHAAPARWSEPRTAEEVYPAEEPLADKTYLTLHWWLGSVLDPEQTVLRYILDLILTGNEAAPLKKALIDSKLGQDLAQTGVFEVGAQAVFAVGLKGSEPDRSAAFETLVLDTLRRVADQGVTPEQVSSAFQQAAYHYLEILPMFPIHMMDRVISVWPYGGDPLAFLDMGRYLASARARWESDADLFSRLIRKDLLENPHRLRTVLRPDPGWTARTEAAWSERLRAERARLDDASIRRLADEAAELRRQAGEPNPPEAIAKLPRLSTRDLPARPQRLPTVRGEIAGVTVLRNDVFSNGVNYLDLYLDLADLPEEDWPWFALYVSVFSKLGAAGLTYEQVAARKAAFTGRLSCSLAIEESVAPGGRPMRGFLVSCKTLDDQAGSAFDLLGDVLFRVEPRNLDRLRLLLAQSRAQGRSALLNNSLGFAMQQALRGLSAVGRLSHRCRGLPAVDFIAQLHDRFDRESDQLMQRLERVRERLRKGVRLTAGFTGSERGWKAFEKAIVTWASDCSATAVSEYAPAAIVPDGVVRREALALPIQVAFCVQALTAPHYLDPAAAAFQVGCQLLHFDYLLSEIRLKGNAYGAGVQYNPQEGTLQLYSYRDPTIARTLSVFAGLPEFARRAAWTQSDVDRAIIGVAKNAERPIRPEMANYQALDRHLAGLTDERRDELYAALLAATPASVKNALASLHEETLGRGSVCVAAGRAMIETANRELGAHSLAVVEPAMPI
jgi:hypothetical protein